MTGTSLELDAPFFDTCPEWSSFASLESTVFVPQTVGHGVSIPGILESDLGQTLESSSSIALDLNALAMATTNIDQNCNTHASTYMNEDMLRGTPFLPPSPEERNSTSSEKSSPSSKLSIPKSSSQLTESTRIEKRRQNTLAARRYRQKRVDQMTSLESTLKETQDERDALKVRVARLEGEVETLRQLLRSRN